jgi:acetyl esterase/lipase
MHRSTRLAVAALVALVVAATSFAPAGARSSEPVALPAALPAFYEVPAPLPPGEPGEIIKSEVVPAPGLNGTLLRVMYHSRSVQGADIAVTGLIAVPRTEPVAGGYPVMAWAHGTTGIADECAPSLDSAGAIDFANPMLDRGWVVTATDFEGLGTPGRHPYIVGDSQGRSVLDSVRAARELPEVDASDEYVVWGHSQGGHAAMFALHIAESWAPELELRGVVAGAPPSQLDLVYDYLKTSPFRYYLLMVAAAINAAYGDVAAPLPEVLNPQGIEKLDLVDQGCTGYLRDQTGDLSVEDLMIQQPDGTYNPFSNPTWGPLIAAQDPQNFDTAADAPLLIIHGGDDEQIPTVSSEILAGQLCSVGQELERWVYPGASHAGVIAPSYEDMVTWMADRFSGTAPSPEATAAGDSAAESDRTICVDGKLADPDTPVSSPTTTEPGYGLPGFGYDAPPAMPLAGRPSYTG